MFKRDLSKYGEEENRIYQKLVEEGEKLFEGDTKKITIFHQMLIDRVADAYVATLSLNVDAKSFSEKKFKAAQDKLQRWLAMSFAEMHSAKREQAKRQAFYKKCVEELNKVIVDESLRRDVFRCLKNIVDEGDK
jgi:hypothetical protein